MLARYQQGARGAQRKKASDKTYGRSRRAKRYPLMPDGLTRDQAVRWYEARYGRVPNGA